MTSISLANTALLKEAQARIQQDLEEALAAFSLPEPLKSAVYHAVMLGGKRIRPALCYATSHLVQATPNAAARRAAVAVEFIHCYSLVHDDLPCMDNDLLRRGQPTCHVAFGEDTALLAGDVLQSMAFEVLGSRLFDQQQSSSAELSLKQMQILATASSNMVKGQLLDLQAEGQSITQQALETIHINKTGALIQAAILLGAFSVFEPNHPKLLHLRKFGHLIGLAFQVHDDILDVTATTEVLGKTAGKDQQVAKSTYPALMGLAAAEGYALELQTQALSELKDFGESAQPLIDIAEFVLSRQN